MIAKYNRKSLILGVPGLLLQFGCIFESNSIAANIKGTGPLPSIALIGFCEVGIVVGGILLIIGLCFYAKAKGHSAVWGLFGLLSCIGLLVLALLPDKAKGGSGNAAA
jgi:hypothetical protein